MKDKYYTIYTILCLINKKVYVGYTGSFYNRKILHFSKSEANRNSNDLYLDIKKFGKKSFVMTGVIEYIKNLNDAKFLEKEFMIQCVNDNIELYNVVIGDGEFIPNVNNTETHKECSCCKNILLRTSFVKNKSTYDGLEYYCKKCWSKYKRNKKYGINIYINKGHELNNSNNKYCPDCKMIKPRNNDYFYNNNKSSKDKLNSICKICCALKHKRTYMRTLKK